MITINEDSVIGKQIHEIESLMDKYGIAIYGPNLRIIINNTEYHIGRDSNCFPRFIEEPFWRNK